jgi:hypothetical protein
MIAADSSVTIFLMEFLFFCFWRTCAFYLHSVEQKLNTCKSSNVLGSFVVPPLPPTGLAIRSLIVGAIAALAAVVVVGLTFQKEWVLHVAHTFSNIHLIRVTAQNFCNPQCLHTFLLPSPDLLTQQ